LSESKDRERYQYTVEKKFVIDDSFLSNIICRDGEYYISFQMNDNYLVR